MLTANQISTLKTLVQAEPTLSTARATGDDIAIAAWLNTPVVEQCWRTSMTLAEIHDVMDWDEFIARSVAEKSAFTCMLSLGTINPSRPNIRQGWANIFSGSTTRTVNFRATLTAAAQRPMTRAEKALATGPVSGTYTLTFEGEVSYADASALR